MLMGSIPSIFGFSMLHLFVPLVVLFNLLFFLYWLLQMKWPFLLFMGAFLLGYGEWDLLYQFPKTEVHKSGSTIAVMSYNVRLFNQYRWIDRADIPEQIEQLIQEQQPDVICFQEFSKKQKHPVWKTMNISIFNPVVRWENLLLLSIQNFPF